MIGSVVNLGTFLLDFASRIYPESKDITSAADMANKARHSYNVINTSSITQSANRAIIAPLVVIEDGLLHQEFMPDLMQIVMLRDIVATLTHLAFQNSTGMGVKVESIIGSINPKRSGMLSVMGAESLGDSITPPAPPTLKNGVTTDSKTIDNLTEYTPLAIGKVVNATVIGDNGVKIDFPLTFRQIPMPVKAKDLNTVFSAAKIDQGYFARLLMWETKEITGPEFLTGKDIIREQFRIKNEDMSGYYKEAMTRETGNKMAALRTGQMSVNSLANTFIMGKSTQAQLELNIGKRFDNASSLMKIFSAVKANTIVVCDEDRGIYKFYTHGSSMVETYTRKDLTVKSKKDAGGSTLNDLVKLLNGGA